MNDLMTWIENQAGGGGAPTDATYVVMSPNATLTNERVLTAGTNMSIVDGGPGMPVTLNATGGVTSPLTTKGDLWGWNTTNARVPVGADGTVLTADSGDTEGVSWQAPTAYAPLNATYIVVSLDGTLPNERVLTAGTNISFVDGGAGGAFTINASGGGGAFDWGKYIAGRINWPIG
jgi:hypothetical protein